MREDIPFPLFFFGMWMVMSTFFTWFSGWFAAAKKYPDREEEALFTLSWESGSLNGMSCNATLCLSPCVSGLRVHVVRIFMPLAKPFFVPWEDIVVSRNSMFGFKRAELAFGSPPISRLKTSAFVVNRLARAAGARWPEGELVPAEDQRALVKEILWQWSLLTLLAGVFFLVLTRFVEQPPIESTVGVFAFALVGCLIDLWKVRRID